MNKLFWKWFFLIFVAVTGAFGQARGAIHDEEIYDNLPRRATFASSTYEGLPSSFSLKQFAPLPGDQGNFGTCVGWAAAYAARTISESIVLNRLNQTETTRNAFSPFYTYRSIRPEDPNGIMGASVFSALDFLRDTGAVRMLEIERLLSIPNVDLSLYKNSRNYPIGGYVALFSINDRQKPALVTRIVKKSLTEGKPVIIAMNTPDSFLDARNVWRPRENPNYYYYGHAMVVVSYDDNRYGGAFEVMNSWGRKWGNGGFIWIPYDTFTAFVLEAYEMIENIANYSDTIRFDGFVRMEHSGETAELNLTPQGFYRTAETFSAGTQYRVMVGARESAYVYTFSVTQPSNSSRISSPTLLFPQSRVSPLLNYSDSMVILPGEDMTLTLDTQAGTKYIITLYSKQALDILTIMHRFETTQGSINKRLVEAIDDITTDLLFSENEADFSVTLDNLRTVAALIVAIDYR